MDELAARRIEGQRDAAVVLLRTIADRLATLAGSEAREPLHRLAGPLETLAHEAASVLGSLPASAPPDGDDGERPDWATVVFVRRGGGAGA
ncbi:MAG: hypothetical protein KIT14_18525 [bacterium]|nr:hypothetical protein [bacterium]